MNRPEILYPAYLLMRHIIGPDGIPMFVGAGIYSEQRPTTMGNEIYSLVMEMKGNSYQAASDNLESLVHVHPSFSWLAPFLKADSYRGVESLKLRAAGILAVPDNYQSVTCEYCMKQVHYHPEARNRNLLVRSNGILCPHCSAPIHPND